MDQKQTSSTKRTTTKISLVALITLLMLIPLILIRGVISEREYTKKQVISEISASYAGEQTIVAPTLKSTVMVKRETESDMSPAYYEERCTKLNFTANVETTVRNRSIYDVIVYTSTIDITGKFKITKEALKAVSNTFRLSISDFKGLASMPKLTFGGKIFDFEKDNQDIAAKIELPEGTKEGDIVDFSVKLNVKGTEKLYFQPSATETTINITSSYPHPSFQGDFLPDKKEITVNGFTATWNVLSINMNHSYDKLGVKFVDTANTYQQAMRSAKYGILIIILVFVAGLLVELLTKKEINTIQYAVIGLSLVLFYSLLLAFSEFMRFPLAYAIAAIMTISALTLYFHNILKSKSGYTLGGFVLFVYVVNYMLLQMETYALLSGSLILFFMLCIVMYLTANLTNRE